MEAPPAVADRDNLVAMNRAGEWINGTERRIS
jgi:hypothetical protein